MNDGVVPRNGYYSTTKESFSISRDIPSLGRIEDGIVLIESSWIDQITTINIQAPVKEERPLSIEERHEQAKDFLEDDRILSFFGNGVSCIVHLVVMCVSSVIRMAIGLICVIVMQRREDVIM